ncbi:MAG: hypothetical protein Q9166_004355 [cf. Caloplaca sp. 2 TL-2023]
MSSTVVLTKPTGKSAIGASVQPVSSPNTSNHNLPTPQPFLQSQTNDQNNNPSTTSLPAAIPNPEPETYDPTSINPFSPFYSHARASESRSRVHIRSSTTSDHDLEKGYQTGITITTVPSKDPQQPTQEQSKCNKQSLLCKSEAKKAQGWWRNLSKRQKLLVHCVIALIFVGAVTGLGVGVSKAMGTGIWKSTDSAGKPIGMEE